MPFSKVGHFSVRYEDLNIVVEADIGLKVIWNTESYLEVHVSSRYDTINMSLLIRGICNIIAYSLSLPVL